jgi:hypothetical protein
MNRVRGCAVVLSSFLFACGGSDGTTQDGGGDPDGGAKVDSAMPDGALPDGGGKVDSGDAGGGPHVIDTVFIILMENHSWSTIKASKSAPYINNTLVPAGGHAEQFFTPPKLHPSEPNYIWLEAGDNLGITTDDDPAKNHKAVTDHLSTQLDKAQISWKAYAEDISGTGCPLTSSGIYGTKHIPQLFFDDVTGANDPNSKNCEAHIRPYKELASDLSQNKVARYNFITPNLCNDMHGELIGTTCNQLTTDMIKKGDDWLKAQVPAILASNAFKNGVLFIHFDEGDENLINGASDGPIPMIVLSPYAKKNYASSIHYTHSSMLRTIETIFSVPFLRDAANATDLRDFFTQFP